MILEGSNRLRTVLLRLVMWIRLQSLFHLTISQRQAGSEPFQ